MEVAATVIIGVLTVAISSFTAWYLGPLRRTRVGWKVESTRLIPRADDKDPNFEDVQVLIGGKEVADPVLHRIHVWNFGPKDILSSDFDSAKPIRIDLRAPIVAEVDKGDYMAASYQGTVFSLGPGLLSANQGISTSVITEGIGKSRSIENSIAHSTVVNPHLPAPRWYEASLSIGFATMFFSLVFLGMGTYFYFDMADYYADQVSASQKDIGEWEAKRRGADNQRQQVVAEIEKSYAENRNRIYSEKKSQHSFFDTTTLIATAALGVSVVLVSYGGSVALARRKIKRFLALR